MAPHPHLPAAGPAFQPRAQVAPNPSARSPTLSWSSPSAGDVYRPGDSLRAVWTAPEGVISPSFSLCSSEGVDGSAEGDVEGGCGTAVWPWVDESSVPTYSMSMTIPDDVSGAASYVVRMTGNLGDVYYSPSFSLTPLNPVHTDSAPVEEPVAALPSSRSPVAGFTATTTPLFAAETLVPFPSSTAAMPVSPLASAPPTTAPAQATVTVTLPASSAVASSSKSSPPASASLPPADPSSLPTSQDPSAPSDRYPPYGPSDASQNQFNPTSFLPSPQALTTTGPVSTTTLAIAIPLSALALILLLAALIWFLRRRKRAPPPTQQQQLMAEPGSTLEKSYGMADFEKALQLVTQATVRVALDGLHEPPITVRPPLARQPTPMAACQSCNSTAPPVLRSIKHVSFRRPPTPISTYDPYTPLERATAEPYPRLARLPASPPLPAALQVTTPRADVMDGQEHASLTIVESYETPRMQHASSFSSAAAEGRGGYGHVYDAVARVLDTPRA